MKYVFNTIIYAIIETVYLSVYAVSGAGALFSECKLGASVRARWNRACVPPGALT
jgi:hypothetical protein